MLVESFDLTEVKRYERVGVPQVGLPAPEGLLGEGCASQASPDLHREHRDRRLILP